MREIGLDKEYLLLNELGILRIFKIQKITE